MEYIQYLIRCKVSFVLEESVKSPALYGMVYLKHGETSRGRSTTKPFPVTILTFDWIIRRCGYPIIL